MNILAIDTSTNVCSVCLLSNAEVVAEYTGMSSQTHTERLLPAVEFLLVQAAMMPQDLNLLAVVHGPGSFTGLRIGLSVAKGLAFALQLPVIGANALEIAASQIGEDGLICPAMDARRNQIFTCLYERRKGEMVLKADPVSVHPQDWRERLPDRPIFFCGPGASLYWDTLKNHDDSRLLFRDFILARTLAMIAEEKFRKGDAIDGKDLRAAYLRPSDAEEKGPRPWKGISQVPVEAKKKK